MTATSRIKSVAIWGLGNVGTGFALALKPLPISLYLYSSSKQSRDNARSFGLDVLDSLEEWNLNAIGHADLIALGWSDDALPDAQPRHLDALRPDQTLIHFSGALNAAELGQGPAETASLHPLAACPSPQRAARTFAEGPLVLEGTDEACDRLRPFLRALGSSVHHLNQGQKTAYHAGAVLASNALVGLLHAAQSQWEKAGLLDTQETLLVSLANSALEAVRERGLGGGLTGPLKRGDIGTINRHLATLDAPTRELYQNLSQELMKLLGKNHFETKVYEALNEILRGSSLNEK